MQMRTKSVFQRIEQKNRLMSFLFGPNAGRTNNRQKLRLIRALFGK
jgi:hypothetical protein